MIESQFQNVEIPIANITDDSAGEHRAIDEAFVAELAESIRARGWRGAAKLGQWSGGDCAAAWRSNNRPLVRLILS